MCKTPSVSGMFWLLVVLLTLGCHTQKTDRSSKQRFDDDLWLLVAKSEVITQGTVQKAAWSRRVDFAIGRFLMSFSRGGSALTAFTITPSLNIKGDTNLLGEIAIYKWKNTPYTPSIRAWRRLKPKPVIAFVNPPATGPDYSSLNGLFAANPSLVSDINTEIARQKEIDSQFDKIGEACVDDPLYPKVKSLINQMTNEATQMVAAEGLLSLGKAAIPSIICQMDDARPMPRNTIRIKTPPGFFEPYAQYRANIVFDALNTVLESMSGVCFGPDISGTGPRAPEINRLRVHQMHGWKVLCHRLMVEQKPLPKDEHWSR